MNMLSLDHLVINAGFSLDPYRSFFSSLGFMLTPKSHHSLGSVNHLIVFRDSYLELVGLEQGGSVRKEILESHMGIDGLVFSMDEEDAIHDRLEKAGLAVSLPQRFSRVLESGEIAEFVTVRTEPGQFAEGRVYFCRHLTPELVWQEGFTVHPNGVTGISRLAIAASDPEATRQAYGRIGHLQSGLPDIFSLDEAKERFGLGNVRPDSFLAISFSGADIDRLKGYLRDAGVSFFFLGENLLVPMRDGTLLEFES